MDEEEVYTDGYGNYFDAYGRTLDYNDLIARGIDVLGAWASRSPYYGPDDPRYRNQQQGRYPTNYPAGGYGAGGNVPATVNPQGFQLTWWAAGLIGIVVGSFLLGKRGR